MTHTCHFVGAHKQDYSDLKESIDYSANLFDWNFNLLAAFHFDELWKVLYKMQNIPNTHDA